MGRFGRLARQAPADANMRCLKERVERPAQAKANQRSLEGEVRHVLTREVSDYLRTAEFLERADALAATTSGTKRTDSTVLIREDRDR